MSNRTLFGIFLIMALLTMLTGCGTSNEASATPATQASELSVKAIMRVVSPTSQEWQFTLDKDGFINLLRDGGKQFSAADVDYVVYVSYRFGTYKTSPLRMPWNASGKILFTDLPNNDQWDKCYVVFKNGEKALVEARLFEHIELPGFYSYIDVADSDIEWGDFDDPRAQDEMKAEINPTTLKAKITGQFGCNLLFALKANEKYLPGASVIFIDGDGITYQGTMTQDSDGFISYEVGNISVKPGPYGYNDENAKTSGRLYVLFPDGHKTEFCFGYNTATENEDVYVWYLDSSQDGFWVESYSEEAGAMRFNYSPPPQNN